MTSKEYTRKLSYYWPGAPFTGIIIFLMCLLTLLNTALPLGLEGIATALAWLYIVIETPRLKPKQRKQILILFSVGVLAAALAWSQGANLSLQALLGEHLKLAMLLAAVTFIGMASQVGSDISRPGIRSFLTTLSGMHLFSSVANFSAVIVVGDQIRKKEGIDFLSQLVLSRGFGMAVLWSPFLSLLPLVLEQVPGVELSQVYPFSIAIAITGLLLSMLEARFRASSELKSFAGYPLKTKTLILPVTLIMMILLLSWQLPSLPTVFLVSLLSIVVPLCLLMLREGIRQSAKKTAHHITGKLSESRAEISLFMSAGVLAAGVKSCISAGLISLPFTETNAGVASLVLMMIVGLAYLGIHQLALVAIFAGLLADITTTPNLMAISYILGTALAMSGSTFSGLNFIMKARFLATDTEIIRNQLPYNLVMIGIGCGVIYLMEAMGIK
ncbi:hypothetical protein [Amphritea japonica]|uniref:Uncharacterized protein n=1 Tax=Amphritea japonica ATCC BAA-1530 TaxID=1278309 RepID=A0A7R6SSQ0_9GAMM|nr:hypothetical protein [Amphritea japonica]BBB26579.1 conserved hypothetical protein [Amphritea japonica ATCC BAA-1530]